MYRRLGTFILFISFSITSLIGQVKVIQVLSESDHVPVPFAQIVLSDSSYRTNTEGVVYINSVQ